MASLGFMCLTILSLMPLPLLLYRIHSLDGMDQVELFEAICHENYYPFDTEPSELAIEVVDGLLEKDAGQRLGMLAGGSKDILNHPWFDDIDLGKMRNKLLRAPWRPVQEDGDDFPEDCEYEFADDDGVNVVDDIHALDHIIEEEDSEEGLDESLRKTHDDDDDAGLLSPIAEMTSPNVDGSRQAKPKVKVQDLVSPKRETKKEKEKSSKERRATVSGALFASLAGAYDESFSEFNLNHITENEEEEEGTASSNPQGINSNNSTAAGDDTTFQNRLDASAHIDSEEILNDMDAPKSPPPGTGNSLVKSPSSGGSAKVRGKVNKPYVSPKQSKEASKARRETVSGAVLASLAGLGVDADEDEDVKDLDF